MVLGKEGGTAEEVSWPVWKLPLPWSPKSEDDQHVLGGGLVVPGCCGELDTTLPSTSMDFADGHV